MSRSSHHVSEESKVNLKPNSLPCSSVEKKAQAKACVLFQLLFKEQGPSQGERSLLRWFWSFTGTRGTAQPEPALRSSWYCFPFCFRLATSPPSNWDKSKVERRP